MLKVQKLAIFFDSFAYCLDKYLRICLIFWSSNYTPNALFFPFLILFISLVWNWSLFSFYFFSVYNWISVIYSSLPYFGKEISFMFMFFNSKNIIQEELCCIKFVSIWRNIVSTLFFIGNSIFFWKKQSAFLFSLTLFSSLYLFRLIAFCYRLLSPEIWCFHFIVYSVLQLALAN